MAFSLDDVVENGEIDCTRNFAIYGWIKLRGHDRPLRLHLTGRPAADLRGRRFRFEARHPPEYVGEPVDPLEGIMWEQIGPPGEFTANRRGRGVDDVMRGEGHDCRHPTAKCRRLLYLEWFSQNGRMTIELADPRIEFLAACDEAPPVPEGPGDAAETGVSFATSDADPDSIGVDVIPWDDAEFPFEAREAADDPDETAALPEIDDELDLDEDPYGLFPKNLQRSFDDEAIETDRQIRDDADEELPDDELELMDALIERGTGERLTALLGDDIPLPAQEELDDEQVEGALQVLLARLAMLGIALDVCEHTTPRTAYRYLVEEIIPEEIGHRELQHTQWVQHFSTWEGCPECAAEFDREWKERHPEEKEPETESSSDLPPDGL